MSSPESIYIPYEDYEGSRFQDAGQYGSGNQFLAFITYAAPYLAKTYSTVEVTPDGEVVIRQQANCFAVLHRFDPEGGHLGSEVRRVEGMEGSEEEDNKTLDRMIADLGKVRRCGIRVKPFQVEYEGVVFGLVYELASEEDEDEAPEEAEEWVMLEPNDIMFHPPWDSGEYST